MAEETVLRVAHCTKRYRFLTAVDDVSFSVRPGEIVGLLGPNGAGKTTIINIVLGVLDPSGGSVFICGKNQESARKETAGMVNFAAVYAFVPRNLTVCQNLKIFGLLYGISHLKQKTELLLEEFDLKRFAATRVGLLSSGEQTRVNIAKAMINAPRLLLLDEPTASLDPSAAWLVRDKIRNYAKERRAGVLWTSHNMHEVEAVCDRVLFLSRGKILLSGNPKTIAAERGKTNLEELFVSIAREPLLSE